MRDWILSLCLLGALAAPLGNVVLEGARAGAARIVEIATGYVPRPWQENVHQHLKRFSILVIHRRAGKTVLAVNTLIDAALRTRKPNAQFAYIAPFLKQAKQLSWSYLKAYTHDIPGLRVLESELAIIFPNGARIQLFGADHPDAIRGNYFDGVVIDEVAQVKPELWGRVISPALADRLGWALLLGTPKGVNLLSELYYKALEDPENWYAAILTIDDTHALPDEEVERMKGEMSEAEALSELYCDFAAYEEDILIPLNLALEAASRIVKPDAYSWAPKILGVDCARSPQGDLNSICPRQGVATFRLKTYRSEGPHWGMTYAGRIANAFDKWDADAIMLDLTGVGGGAYDRLTQLGYPVYPVEFGRKALDRRFSNLASEMWWKAKAYLEAGGTIPNNRRLLNQLSSRKFSYANARGQFEIESKDKLKERGLPSPDEADSFVCTFAYPIGPRTLEDKARRLGIRGPAADGERAEWDSDPYRS